MEMGHHHLLLYFVSLSAGECRKPQNCSVVGLGKISTTEHEILTIGLYVQP